ncbi:MAG: hypothetical protein LBU03_04575 [Tannerellaceae bacterium]|jgi:tetratricopeptide (TPR) repeat protein|nr:hypothetical protein [Tannerellaceae bacterium]
MEEEIILSRGEAFIRKYSRTLLIGVGSIAGAVALYLAAQSLYFVPRNARAANDLFRAEHFFRQDSFTLALHGNGADIAGFAKIADEYGSAPSANLAKGYAAICAYRLGEYETALLFLEDFNTPDDGYFGPVATGLKGDCFANLGEVKKAIGLFEKAARLADNDLLSPTYLKKAAAAYESLEEYDKAASAYARIKEKYYTSREAEDIDKYITRAQLLHASK